ncbi:minor tail protein [Gordonia phage Phlop]|uniref:Minor tail protein n=9 Tax=Wizardvirus TaxID=2169658 RepID=A0A7D5FU23_9CAUD|nr:minor tail protein [Gordonia phage Wizard]YP_010096735.1 minor tail protein [Gordonia phage KimmyK]YP_010101995.1 minor tail protein [Gordonia phage SmokingBunny]YP_010102381.1 minor tail protein [Gordonia phage Valary]YP_010103637.1 minor tail protein [Gordonia phage Nubi]YP_010107669.1 minor tail protein [Gordonia phage Evamon]YP_010109295.1 minor tail protein [Gordonia phage Jambalaya]YP_010114952.1 minor tail protein [Gordonia phage Phlop]UVK62357.1 minor tail protein [Gordonia phage
MTTPNLGPGDIGDYDEAANNGNLSDLQGANPSAFLQGEIGGMTGPVGAVGSAIFGAVGGVVGDVVGYSEPGQKNLGQARGFVLGKLPGVTGGLLSPVLKPLALLLSWVVGGSPSDWDTIEEIRDNLIPALIRLPLKILVGLIGGIPVVGDAFENALAGWLKNTNETAVDAAETVVSVGTQVNQVQEVIALQSGMGVHEAGPDRTGTPSFNFGYFNLNPANVALSGGSHEHNVTGSTSNATVPGVSGSSHNHGAGSGVSGLSASSSGSDHVHNVTMNMPTVAATASYAPWANVIFKSAAERKVLTWIAYKTGTVSTFNLDVYKLEEDGSSTLVYSSPNLAGDVPVSLSSIGWMQHLMSGASIIADYGDVYDVQFRMTGSGAVHIAGINFFTPTPLPGFRPYTSGSQRNPSTTPAPTTIPTTTRDTMYTGPCPFVAIGIDVGQTEIPRFFFDDFNRASLGPRWIRYGDIGISDNKVAYTGSAIANATAAAMYHQPLNSDVVEVGADLSVDAEDIGFGLCCTSGLGSGMWLVLDEGGIALSSGAYNSRTARAVDDTDDPPSGRYTVRRTRSVDDTHYVFDVYFGDPSDEENEPILTWPDTGNVIAAGVGRRWWGLLARRNGLINPSGRLDNVTAADITTEEEP